MTVEQPRRAARGKAVRVALIPCLALILIVLLLTGGDREAASETDPGPSGGNPPAAASAHASPRPDPAEDRRVPGPARRREGPTFELAEILRHNPFSLPASLRPAPEKPAAAAARRTPESTDSPVDPPAKAEEQAPDKAGNDTNVVAQLNQRIAALERLSTAAIVSGPQGAMAIIDSRLVAVGDDLQDGVRVVEIRPDGVIVELVEKPDGH
jgi:hypothetical protein